MMQMISSGSGSQSKSSSCRGQSSMDFMRSAKIDINDNGNIRRLSHRLQRTERMLSSPTYHPYARSIRSPAPFESSNRVQSLHPSTPSSSTLNSSLSGSQEYDPRKSFSSNSSTSEDPFIQPINPRVRRIKRAETFTSSSLHSPMRSLKRAPSYGGSSRNSLDSVAMSVDYKAKDSDVTSSDEEEKLRSKKAKKARTQASSPTPTTPSVPFTPASSRPMTRSKTSSLKTPAPKPVKSTSTVIKPGKQPSTPSSKAASRLPRANLQRNSSIIGPELPNPQPNLAMPTSIRSPRTARPAASSKIVDTPTSIKTNSTGSVARSPPVSSPVGRSPSVQSPPKTLRRSKGTAPATRRAPARKISFGSLLPAAEEENDPEGGAGCGLGLGSAFQLR
ncbi:unnamed protein product [Somion occarium]|uniref:Proteophosphoglycan n=1 Tax=Somion occarium TaxID=3059160 RepID=A0ABP1E9L1_9APHY